MINCGANDVRHRRLSVSGAVKICIEYQWENRSIELQLAQATNLGGFRRYRYHGLFQICRNFTCKYGRSKSSIRPFKFMYIHV